jgi:hypothetical protein
MNCVDCGKEAHFLYEGNSLCKPCLLKRRIKGYQGFTEVYNPKSGSTQDIEAYLKKKEPWLFEP